MTDQSSHSSLWVGIIVAVIVGLGGGYYFGLHKGVLQEKAAETARKQAAVEQAAQAVNPFGQTTANPFEKAQANPYQNVKVNPFQ